jgi:hypothetical protein
MLIELKIEKQYFYSVTKALREKNDQVFQVLLKSLMIFTCFILLT